MIQSIFVHLLKQNTRQFNSWLLLLEKHGVLLGANVHKTSFIFSAFSHCISCQWEPENPRFIIPGPLIYTGLLKQPTKVYIFLCLQCTNQHTKDYRKHERVKWSVLALFRFLVNSDIIISTSVPQQKRLC